MNIRSLLILGLLLTAVLLVAALPPPPPLQAGTYTIFLPQVSKHHPLQELSGNLLPNPSFEEGWYHHNGAPELQIPEQWRFAYEEGDNPLDPAEWNDWVRPESRVLPSAFLPEHEHELFIWEGDQTVKIFKGWGSISFELVADVWLEPGMYLLEISFYPDLVTEYDNGQKVFAPDPYSGEFRFIVGDRHYPWWLPEFGAKNTLYRLFTIEESGWVAVGAGMRGRWAILNNGWFMDNWRLVRVGSG